MSAIYLVTHTDPASGAITVTPNNFDGPGAISETTNLTLYGAGSLQYGQEFNENFLKLLENFSSPGVLAGSPLSYVPAIDSGGSPQFVAATVNSNYFNPTTAQTGQAWFNSTINKLMIYDGSTWNATGRVFSGLQAPTGKIVGDVWYDTTAGDLKVLQSTGPDVWSGVAGDYVLKGGDTMSGNLAMGTNEVTGLPASPSATGAASKEYVDTQHGLQLNLAGGTMSGAINMGSQKITSLDTPTAGGDATNKTYVDGAALTAALQAVYPVGAIWMSSTVVSNPQAVLGFGTWTEIPGRMLIGEGDNGDGKNYGIGSTGGDKDAAIVNHTHPNAGDHTHTTTGGGTPSNTGASGDNKAVLDQPGNTGTDGDHGHGNPVGGVSATDANLPPYYTVYIWRRTA